MIVNQTKTWNGANIYCKTLGGNLVHIDYESENDRFSLLKGTYWIGLRSRPSKGFVWENGKFNYKKLFSFLFIYILSSQYNLYNILPDEGYSKNVPCSLKLISMFVFLCLVPESIIRPIVSAGTRHNFKVYFFYRSLQFLNPVIIIKTKVYVT